MVQLKLSGSVTLGRGAGGGATLVYLGVQSMLGEIEAVPVPTLFPINFRTIMHLLYFFFSYLKWYSINEDRDKPVERDSGDVHSIVLEVRV